MEDSDLKPVTEGGNVTISAVANADVANVMMLGLGFHLGHAKLLVQVMFIACFILVLAYLLKY